MKNILLSCIELEIRTQLFPADIIFDFPSEDGPLEEGLLLESGRTFFSYLSSRE